MRSHQYNDTHPYTLRRFTFQLRGVFFFFFAYMLEDTDTHIGTISRIASAVFRHHHTTRVIKSSPPSRKSENSLFFSFFFSLSLCLGPCFVGTPRAAIGGLTPPSVQRHSATGGGHGRRTTSSLERSQHWRNRGGGEGIHSSWSHSP